MRNRRVVVTGVGVVSPLGLTAQQSWQNAKRGVSGIHTLIHLNTNNQSVRFGGSVWGFDIEHYLPKKEARKMDVFIHYGMVAAMEAIADSGLKASAENAHRIGVAVGAGIGGLSTIEATTLLVDKRGPSRISPFFVPSSIINMISGNLSIKYGFCGPNFSITTACTTGTHNIGDAARLIEYGDADAMVAGGAEMPTTVCGLGGFAAAKALSTRNDSPETASRPWDKDRDGFVLADGAGVVVLEEYECAKARGANIYAELSGYGMSADAYHITKPLEDGRGAAQCMINAINNAGINCEQIDYINAHGTSTSAGDLAETQAVKSVFGDYAYRLAMSSTKSMTGHLLGAAGGLEAVFTVLSIKEQCVAPTINIFNQDAQCDLDYVPNTARDIKINHAISNSFGFGGTNGSLVFSRV